MYIIYDILNFTNKRFMEGLETMKGVEHVLHFSRRKDIQKPLKVPFEKHHLRVKRWGKAFQQMDLGNK